MAGRSFLTVSVLLLSSLGHSSASMLLEKTEVDGHVEAFHDYMRTYSRGYEKDSEEYHQRLALFAQRRLAVRAQNTRPDRLWTAALNKLADRTEAELSQLRGWKGGVAAKSAGMVQREVSSSGFLSQRGRARAIPQEFMNWTKLSTATSGDQAACGSCWAVTSAEVLHMHAEIYNPNHPRSFSSQELVSCVPNELQCGGTGGCEGATVELAYHWVQSYGLARERETPYEGVTGTCKKKAGQSTGMLQLAGHGSQKDAATVGVHKAPQGSPAAEFGMVGFERLAENSFEATLRAVVERGPVAVSVAAKSWSYYSGGVFDACGDYWVIDHAVALVGYGTDRTEGKALRYYALQNSWGEDWGEHGRIRILMSDRDGENCGTDTQPLMGTGCKGGPAQVKVCGPCGILYDNVVPHFKKL